MIRRRSDLIEEASASATLRTNFSAGLKNPRTFGNSTDGRRIPGSIQAGKVDVEQETDSAVRRHRWTVNRPRVPEGPGQSTGIPVGEGHTHTHLIEEETSRSIGLPVKRLASVDGPRGPDSLQKLFAKSIMDDHQQPLMITSTRFLHSATRCLDSSLPGTELRQPKMIDARPSNYDDRPLHGSDQ